jgi:hypothetical protein
MHDHRGALMLLPDDFVVRVKRGTHPDVRLDSLLIGLVLRHNHRDYYATLLGLTDDQGMLRVAGALVEQQYKEDQGLFPMDYKLKLAQCDPAAIVSLAGGRDFEERRANALRSPLLAPTARSWWADAQNEGLAADEAALTLGGSQATVQLTARRIGVP